MGQAAGGIASVASIASLGLSAMGSVMQGKGVKAADEMKAAQLERAAQYGAVQANLTDTTMREKLNTTLGNIETIRAAARVDPSSPTTGAIEDWQEKISDRQRMAAVSSIKAQSAEDLASAAYLRQAGDFALKQSYLGAAAGIAGGMAEGFTSGGGFNLGTG